MAVSLIPGLRSGSVLLKDASEFFQRVFFNAGYIGPADIQLSGYFPLGLLRNSKETVAQTDHLIFFWGKKLFHIGHQAADIFPCRIFCHNIHRRAFDNIKKTDLVSLFICSDRLVERNFSGMFFLGAEHHQKLVVDTSGCVGGKPRGF